MELLNSKDENVNRNNGNVMAAIKSSLKELKIDPLSFNPHEDESFSHPQVTSKKFPKQINTPPKWAQKLRGSY